MRAMSTTPSSSTLMTTANLELVELSRADRAEMVGVLARGMRDNPLHVAAYGPDPERRLRIHGRLMAALFTASPHQRPFGLRRNGALVALAGVAPVGTCRPSARQKLALMPSLARTGPRTAARVGRWLSAWEQLDPPEPHSHLGPVAVDAHLQGQGIGSVLLSEYARRLDAAGEVGYLETDKPENVRFYERAGFVVTSQRDVIGVPNWFMRREPLHDQDR